MIRANPGCTAPLVGKEVGGVTKCVYEVQKDRKVCYPHGVHVPVSGDTRRWCELCPYGVYDERSNTEKRLGLNTGQRRCCKFFGEKLSCDRSKTEAERQAKERLASNKNPNRVRARTAGTSYRERYGSRRGGLSRRCGGASNGLEYLSKPDRTLLLQLKNLGDVSMETANALSKSTRHLRAGALARIIMREQGRQLNLIQDILKND